MVAHPNCHGPMGHVCQQRSGFACYEAGCPEPAGTLWTRHWCPGHDMERIDRITAQMKDMQRALGVLVRRPEESTPPLAPPGEGC